MALSMVLTGGLSGVARTVGALLIGAALTPTSLMTSADLMTSTLTSASATGYVNSRGEADLYLKKRSGDVGVPVLHFLLTTGSSMRGTAGVLPEDPQEDGKVEDQETKDFPETPRTPDFGGAEKKASEEELHQDMKLALPLEEGMDFQVPRTLVQRRVLMLLMKLPEEEILEVEVEAAHEEEGRVFFPLLMNSLALKEEGNQILGMEIESQGQVMNISVMLPVLIIPLMTVILQLVENGLPLSKAWTWHHCHLESVLGMMGQGPLSTEKWKHQVVLLRIEGAKAEGALDLLREYQNLGVPAPWTGITMTDTTETNLSEALLGVVLLPEEAGVAVTGGEGVT